MSVLTKDNAIEHCRTCLEILIKPEQGVSDEESESVSRSKSVSLQSNGDLQNFIKQHVDIELSADELTKCRDFPQNICLGCFKKFQSYETFRREAIESSKTLLTIFRGGPDNIKGLDENEEIIDNIYNILMKDTLMETESVILNAPIVSNINLQDPDPFDDSPTEIISAQDNLVKEEYEISSNKLDCIEWFDDCNDSISSSCDNDPDLNITIEEKSLTKDVLNESLQIEERVKRRTSCKKGKIKSQSLESKCQKGEKVKRRSKGTRNNFKCDQCNHLFAHKITLDAHIRKVHEGSKKPFQCDRCEKSYTFIGGLYTHIKEVHEVEVRSHACDHPGCDRVYTSIIAMQKHKRLKHYKTVELKSYCCEQCGATFKQSGNLKYHMRNKHPTEEEKVEKEKEKEKYSCEICNKSFHSRYTLNYHKLQLHAGEMKYECSVCGRRMAKKFMLAQHMLVHSTDRMPCPHCTKQFIRKFELEAHIKAVHMKLKPFFCQYCGECFASRKTLRHHEYIHTGEKPYVCDICGLGYRQQTCLKNHRKLHFKNDNESSENSNRSKTSTLIENVS